MAEIIGIVSGAITFGTVIAQFANSITGLKNCLDQVRDAPEDLKCLLRTIEIAGMILNDIKEDLADGTTISALRKSKHTLESVEFCLEATEILGTMAKDLARDVQPSSHLRRPYAAMKVVLHRGKVEKYTKALQNALQLLQVSQQCYTRQVYVIDSGQLAHV
ncbi:uncharacterized protein N7484_007863 [Penicillium longicatenatum]|uniref:uncharacterized protein n=1 Tax=Penicillium longicatenatum TaxID=1561947 RepID=UPI0025497F51|nr:uncharacterized protein N7484_007863 [Penicillium longicatenatum]KAJ5640001.1 hypothetical protein N7484_007863 [Penicillium longicatenatum]